MRGEAIGGNGLGFGERFEPDCPARTDGVVRLLCSCGLGRLFEGGLPLLFDGCVVKGLG